MTEKRIPVEQKEFKELFGFTKDYRATVGSLKKALDGLDDDMTIGVLFDSEMAYCNIHAVLVTDSLVRLVGD